MNLKPITPPPAAPLLCAHCHQWKATHADLDGQPFKAYYCPACAATLHAQPTESLRFFVVITQDNETARLECTSLEEAQAVRRSFENYGKCQDVTIETTL